MNKIEWHDLFRYYEDRAPEYDDIYTGKYPGISQPEIYAKDVAAITSICGGHGHGHLIDIGCGTGFWLPYYANNCEEITLIDQSGKMLERCSERVAHLGHPIKVNYVRGDFFQLNLNPEAFDSAVVAFLISHLNEEQEIAFFEKLKGLLKSKAQVLWIDGAWSDIRSQSREKEGIQSRRLRDGREYRIFKRYFTDADVSRILSAHAFDPLRIYVGDVFFAVRAGLSD
ncbi:MAG: methyltransferase domain-containing protein [candidate division WOR-3 bacterium]|nr:MAG: methyltransferase domain-containing protein [candidate division WOR-3 bacterium]